MMGAISMDEKQFRKDVRERSKLALRICLCHLERLPNWDRN
jgi:hypothetical protein